MTALAEHPIPPMTDLKGAYWKQPERSEISVSSNFAKMKKSSWQKLPQYNSTRPTGVYDGKMWARELVDGTRFLCWFGPDEDPKQARIHSRKVLLSED